MNHTERANIAASLEHPPKGAWLRQHGAEFAAGAATRSVTAVLFALFLSAFSVVHACGTYSIWERNPKAMAEVSLFTLLILLCDMLVLVWVFGKIEVRVHKEGGVIFTGVGRVGIKRRFDWKHVSAIQLIDTGELDYRISIEGKRRIKFGALLCSERQEFLVAALSQLRRHFRAAGSVSPTLSQGNEGQG